VTAQCSTLPGHLSPVTVVDHGTLIINDARVTIIDDLGLKQEISGSYLLTYSSKVSLNGTWYINQLGTSRKKPAVSAVTLVNITAHQNRLSLPFLHELSLRNLHHIGTLREKCTMGFFLSYSFALLASFLLCSTIWLGYHVLRIRGQGKPGTNGDVESAGHRDGDHLKEGGVSTTSSHEQNLPSCRSDQPSSARISAYVPAAEAP